MSKENKTSLEQATNELIEIVEVAKKKVKDDLVKEMPDKFDALLNEELNKVSPKKELVKESVKDKKREPFRGKKKTNKKKESVNEMDMREFSMQDIEEAFDDASGAEEFSVVQDDPINAEPSVKAGENGDNNMEDIVAAIDSLEGFGNELETAEIEQQEADPYAKFKELAEQMTQMVKEMDDKKMHEEFGAEFDQQMSGSFGESYKTSIGEEKCNELYEAFVAHKQGTPFGEKVKATNISESDSEDQPFTDNSKTSTEQGKSIAEQKKNGGEQTKGREDGGPTNAMIEEKEDEKVEIEIEDDKVEVEVGEEREDDEKVDEILTNTNAAQRKVQGGHSPNIDVAGKHRNPRTRPSQRSSGGVSENYEKRMKSLIEENKKLTKENSLAKKSFAKAEKLVENYQTHLEKYRTQLREMAVFNTNLANVNNLFVNEELALTGKDKVSIVNKFKTINSIDESDKIYGTILTYLKEGKQTITENVEEKIVTGVAAEATPSTKKKIDEAIERTAYENDDHVNKIKSLMNYVDSARKN